MNKSVIIACITLVFSVQLFSQEGHRERIKAYKTAYITQQVDLSPSEAEKFWPIYNTYDKELNRLKHEGIRKEYRRIKELGGPENLSSDESSKSLSFMLSAEKEAVLTKEKMYNELSGVLTPSKLMRLYMAELNFNKKLLSEFRKKRPEKNMQ